MADLMNSGEKSFSSLASKYKNFMVPAIKIKVQGTDIISSLKLGIESMSVVLPLDSAGSCNFTIVNAYNAEDSKFESKITSKLKLGTIFNVEIGYGSSLELVFKGYVSEISVNFNEMPLIEVTGMDVRKLMMEGKKRMLKHDVKNYSDAFNMVMERYKKICTQLVVDKTNDQLETDGVQQINSDFKFLKDDLALKADREFFVFAGKTYFRKPQKNTKPITTLKWGSSLVSFNRSASYLSSEIIVKGFDEEKNETFVAKEKVKGTDSQIDVVSNPSPTVIKDPDATSMSKAKLRAKAAARVRMQRSQSASGVSVGLPEIVPGRFIKIDKLGSEYNKKYYIKKVQHSFSGDGFNTNFEIGGWK